MRQVSGGVFRRASGYIATHKIQCALIAGGVLAAVLATGYSWWSVVAWQSLAPTASEVRTSVRTSVEGLKREQHTIRDIAEVAKAARADIRALCEVSPLIGWQSQVVSAAKESLKRCVAQKNEVREAHDALAEVYARAASEQKFAQHMAKAQNALDTIDSVDHVARLAQWKELRASLDSMKPHSTLGEAHEAAIAATGGIIASYELLAQAHEGEDRSAFDEATAELERSYSQLSAIQNYSTESFDKLLDALDKALLAL